MGEIVFVGLGLHDEKGISLRGLEEVRTADSVFIELYTSLLPDFSTTRLEKDGKIVLEAAKKGKAVFLVPGDPLIATTHVALRIEAEKHGLKTRIIHGASILSAAIGLSGLHSYKFGKSVTIPFKETPSETPNRVVAQNKKLGLHTLCLLDVRAEEDRYMSINEALETLLATERKKKDQRITKKILAVGIARAGSPNPAVKADSIEKLCIYDFGKPPHTLIFPGTLHFMEAEALISLAKAPKNIEKMVK
jgi:diphthine synthase